jgi:paraquat-inducible protein A
MCYIPANIYPVTAVTSLGQTQEDTILSGVFFLFHHDMWPLALVLFTASVFVPLAKIMALMFLAASVQLGSQWRPVDRTRIYRITEMIGRWSMVDIYVVTILVALVHLGSLATVVPGMGAFYFGVVVVITIFAAEGFDPRLIWDQIEEGGAAERDVSGGHHG